MRLAKLQGESTRENENGAGGDSAAVRQGATLVPPAYGVDLVDSGSVGSVPLIQPKLTVGAPNDKFEREADRVADEIMRMPDPAAGAPVVSRIVGNQRIQRVCQECEQEIERQSLEHGELVQRHPSAAARGRQSLQRAPEPTISVPLKLAAAGVEAPVTENRSQEEAYKEARKKAAEAFMKTELGKRLKSEAEELGREFVSSTEGKIIAGSAIGGVLGGIIAANAQLPVPIPDIALDRIRPGLKATVTYEGPVRKPTKAGLKLTFKSGVSVEGRFQSTAAKGDKPAEQRVELGLAIPLGRRSHTAQEPSESDRRRAQIDKLRIEQARFRESLKTPEERAAELARFLRFRPGLVPGSQESAQPPAETPERQPRTLELNPRPPDGAERREAERPVQRDAVEGFSGIDTAPAMVHDVVQSPGQPLDLVTREFMGSRFGCDFTQVRIHSNPRAAESASAVNARAYTVGRDVVFGTGHYAPRSSQGLHLIAHELTHVLQQQAVAGSARAAGSLAATRVAAASHGLQRTCGADIDTVSGCTGLGGDLADIGFSSDDVFRFQVSCDDFLSGEADRLRHRAAVITPEDTVVIHGFASEEGNPTFNDNLSCARAHAASEVLAEAGVTARINLFKHGATPGPRKDRRSVVIAAFSPQEEEPEDKGPPGFCKSCIATCETVILSPVASRGNFHDFDLGGGKTPRECMAATWEKCLEGSLSSVPRLYWEANCDGHVLDHAECQKAGVCPTQPADVE